MSDEEQLKNIRNKKLAELQQQALQKQIVDQQQREYETKKYQLMRLILSPEGRQRLENIRMIKPQYAEQIELQLIQLYQTGRLKGATPLPDKAFKKLLEQLSSMEDKKEFKIKK